VTVRTPLRLALLLPVACAATLLAACGSSGGGSPTTAGGSTQPASSTSQPASSTSQPASTSSGAKCTDLTPAAASAALGKAVTVTMDAGGVTLPGLTICDVTVADEVYPIQLDVDTDNGQELYDGDLESGGGTTVSGVGDKAFTDAIGIEALSGGVDIKVIGPAGPVLSGNFATPTAIAKAMIAALS
jgi:hypothetical protein